MLARVMSGNSGWDVVFPTSYLIEPMRSFALARDSWITRVYRTSTTWIRMFQEAGSGTRISLWGVPYMWNATGICYSDKIDDGLEAWADLWDRDLQGRITMLDDPDGRVRRMSEKARPLDQHAKSR